MRASSLRAVIAIGTAGALALGAVPPPINGVPVLDPLGPIVGDLVDAIPPEALGAIGELSSLLPDDGPLGALGDLVRPAREAEPVVLTGTALPAWSRLPATGTPALYPGGTDEQNQIGDRVRSAHHGTIVVPPDARDGSNAPVEAITAWRWDPDTGYVEVPVQVDERFPHFLANARSTFSVYSGTDMELTYAWGGDGVSTVGEEAWKKVAGECEARYASESELEGLAAAGVITPGLGETLADYLGPKADPVPGLDDDDEIVFMAEDAGPRAPADRAPDRADVDPASKHEVVLVDPLTGMVSYVYLFLADEGPSFSADDGYVQFDRDATADWWADRNSWDPTDPEKIGTSNTGYGANLPGTACVEADGRDHELGQPRTSTDRFPLDGMKVRTDAYEFDASGRWMKRAMRIAPPDAAPASVGTPFASRGWEYGDDLIDRWKGRAFQQSPDSAVSLVGFEDEQVNWEANAALIGWRSGPVRAIRGVWGADSGTNVTKTETFYRDGVQYRYRVRVHPIPPDGLYTSWDYDGDVAACYYNVTTVLQDRRDGECVGGVQVDGVNDEKVGNIDGFDLDGDGEIDFPAFFDVTDPTFDVPLAFGRWEQVSGKDDNGSLVYLFEMTGPTTLANPIVIPYYRDDACLDDGTGDLPVPRPWPGANSNDQRVVDGYREAGGFGPDDEIPCAHRQGAYGSHGVHFLVTHDSDNAFVGTPVPVTEIDGAQWQWAVPTEAPGVVGDRYAQTRRVPLVPVVLGQGSAVVARGADDGSGTDGGADGGSDGSGDGSSDGATDGNSDGSADGSTDGSTDGPTDGTTDDGVAGPGDPERAALTCDDPGGRFPDDDRPILGCLVDLDLLSGYPDGTFRPWRQTTRRQTAAVLVRYLDAMGALGGDRSAEPAQRLVDAGIMRGRPGGDLALDELVSRGQLATLLVASLRHAGIPLPEDGQPFADERGGVHDRAARQLREAGLWVGYPDGTARHTTAIARGQVASVLWASVVLAEDDRPGSFAR